MPLLLALTVLGWARATHRSWSALGLGRPRSWLRAIVGGIVLGVVLKLVMKAIVMPLLGADSINREYHHLVGNTAALPGMLIMLALVAGFGEEVFFRGFVFERFGRWWGTGRTATIATILVSAALFGLAHVSGHGRDTVIQATIVGLVYGGIYARTRSLWMLMIAHFAFDALAVAIIYLGLEERVAHLLF
jgi:membrane protease YdiL (CAAX protease family)